MADKYTTPAFGIPDRFKTPEQEHQERTSALEGKAVSGGNTWIPGGDFVNTLASSTASSFFGGFAGDAKTLDYVFDADITKDAHHSLRNISDSINQWKPDRGKAAGEKKFFTDDGKNVGDAWGDIFAYADLAGSGIGSIAAMVLGGGLLKIVGKGAVKGAVATSIKKKTDDLLRDNADLTREQAEAMVKKNSIDYAEKYDSAIGTAAYGTAETAIVSGSVGQSIEEEVMRAPAEILNSSDRFREIYYDLKDNNDISHDEAHNSARVQLSREAGIQGAKTVAIPSALLGSIAGRYIDKAISGRLTKSTLANFGILEAIEMPTEGAQGGTEQYVQNSVYKELVDKTRSVWSGVADSAVREALGVAFGVAPLAAISAKVEADAAKGITPTTDRLTENEELTIIDHAIKVDEIATTELLARTASDPQARMQGLMDIIEKGNAGTTDPIPESSPEDDLDMDLDLDEAEVARQAAEAGPDVPDLADPFGDEDDDADPPAGGAGGVTPIPDAPEGTETPAPETPTGPTGPIVGDIQPESQKDLDEGATEPVEDTGWASATANEFQTKRPEFNGLILSFKPGDQRNEQVAAHYYGEIKDTIDKDGMEKDVILNKDYNADTDTPIFIVNQMDWDTGEFRQHKIMAGFDTIEEAQQGYIDQFDAKGFGAINEISQEDFAAWKQQDGQTAYAPVDVDVDYESAGGVTGVQRRGSKTGGTMIKIGGLDYAPNGDTGVGVRLKFDKDGNLKNAQMDNTDVEVGNKSDDAVEGGARKFNIDEVDEILERLELTQPSIGPVDLSNFPNLDRIPANNIAKALGVKTMTSRANLDDRVAAVAAFLENPTVEGLQGINGYLKEPVKEITQEAADALAGTMREALANVEDVPQPTPPPESEPVEDEPTPPTGDIQPEPPKTPEETPPEEAGTDTGTDDDDTTPPVPEDETGTGGTGGTGGDVVPEPPVDKPVDKPVEEKPEPTPEEIAEQEAKDAQAIANREAISEVLAELEPGMKAIIRGTTLTGERVMNPETLELVSETNGIYMMSRGKERRKIILEDGNYYLTSLSNKRSRLITEIERKKQLIQGEAGGNVGGTIRRPHEIWKNDPKTLDDAEKYLVMIGKVTSHANYVKSVNYADKTHGVKRLYTDILATVPPFLKWLAPHIGSEHGGVKPKDAVLAILRNQPLTQFDSNNKVNVQTPEELTALVDNYVEMMTELADLVAGTTTIKQLRNAYARNIFQQEPTVEGQVKIDDVLALDDAEYELQYRNFARGHWQERAELKKGIVPEYKTEGSLANKYPELFPKTTFDAMHHDYKSRIEFDDVSDEKLKPDVPRERRKLSELAAARQGMPDHRKGKQITSDDLVETFGFHGITYGGWVSDVHLEGELSEMQQYNNLVYDSFADLAYLTGLPIKAMGKGLYLSIGAVGQGKSTGLAFFSPNYKKIDVTDEETDQNISDLRDILVNNDVSYLETDNAKTLLKKVEKVMQRDDAVVTRVRVIQFNKEQGDGTFAHEWSHNFGNILNRVESGVAESLKERPSIFGLHRFIKRAINRYIKANTDQYDNDELLGNLKDELEAVMTYSTEFNKPTSYMKNATFMDMKAPRPGGKKYWSNDQELFARATEAYIHDAITAEGDGAANPFLQSTTAADGVITPANGYLAAIYPEGEERQYFNAFMNKMYHDTISTEDGSIDFKQGEETYDLEFGLQAEFERIKKDYLANLDSMMQQAEDARLERLLNEDEDEEVNPLEGLSDEDLLEGLGGKQEELPEIKDKPPGEKTGGKGPKGPPKPGTVTGGGLGLGSTPRPPKTTDDLIKDLGKLGYDLDDTDKALLDDMLNDNLGDDGTRFSMNIEDFGDTRFSVETVQDRNPDLDPVLYAKLARFMSRRWAEYLDAGNRSFPDFGRGIQETLGKSMAKFQPYILQFLKDVRDGNINYRDYVDTPDSGADGSGEGLDGGVDGGGTDEPGDVQQPTDEQTDTGDVDGTTTPGATEPSPDGEGAGTGTDLDNAGDNALAKLSPQELSLWIQKETGLRSPSVEPLSADLGVKEDEEEAPKQVKKKAIAKVRDYENDYQLPTAMADDIENAVLRLSEIVEGEGYEGLDDYVMKQLGYTDVEVFENAFMSLQVEAIAAAIYQMSARRRSIIIADQTGVGKGRQAGALIRWAVKQGKVPVFVTENDSLYTDMYYDMVDSGIEDVRPFITNAGVGIKSRDVDEDEMAQVEHEGGKVPMLHKLPNKKTIADTKEMSKNGKMPAGTNAVFTTYAQMNTVNNRREALTKLAENNEVVLILDESHVPAKYDPNPKRTTMNRNEYFTQLIRDAQSTTYLSATFAKNPENLAFYFNTDLADAMDGMKQLVDVLTAGGVQLQEVMSRALTRNGQLFRREISYEGIEIKTQFGPKDRSKADAYNKRDKVFTNKLTGVIQKLLPVNHQIVNQLKTQWGKDPEGLANLLYAKQQINDTEYAKIKTGVQNNAQIKISFIPAANQIHNLTDQILVASKADLAVDAILDDIENGLKPVIGLDKTNMAMLNEYITRTDKVVGDDMSDLNWAGLLGFWANKSFNVSISVGENQKESDKIRANVGEDSPGVDGEAVAALNNVKQEAIKVLSDINLPLSPIDYISQESERRAQKELGKNIRIAEITGRYMGDYGIDYTGDKPILYKVAKFHKRDVIDAFNGEVKDKDNNKIPSTIDGLIINQSGSTGVSLHSSKKHGDRTERHMTILEPAGNITVFQQMLGRIFRTGMGDTVPYYTVLASEIPADARKINVLMKKMESLNAQTSSNREGSAGVKVEDIMNSYGDTVVKEWVQNNQEFQDIFPQWEKKIGHDKGFAYWVTGKIGLFNYKYQQEFYKEVNATYAQVKKDAIADGTWTLDQKYYKNWAAEYLEEIVIAEPRKDGTGFNEGAWLAKLRVQSDFKAMTPDEVKAAIEEGKQADLAIDTEKAEGVRDIISKLKDSTIAELEALAPDGDPATVDGHISRVFKRYRDSWRMMLDASLHEILGDEYPSEQRRPTEVRHAGTREWLDDNRQRVIDSLPKGTRTKFQDMERTLNRIIKQGVRKATQEMAIEGWDVGKTYQFTIGAGDEKFNTTGTLLSLNRLNNSADPYVMGDVEMVIAANKPGGTESDGTIKRTIGQAQTWGVNPVREWAYGTPDVDEVLKKYHETLAETSKTKDEWVIIGNPLIAASEMAGGGEYMQFKDKYERRMFGIRMRKAQVDQGIEGMIQGNLEIPSEIEKSTAGGGKIIVDYIKENPHSELSRKFGFLTRGGNVRVRLDSETNEGIRVEFDTETAKEKADDPALQQMLDVLGIQMIEFEKDFVFSVPFNDARPVINQILRRSRLVVPGSMKYHLKNYMNISGATKAGENKISIVPPDQVKTYVFEKDNRTITAHRGEYKTRAQTASGEPGYDGFYMEGLSRWQDLEDLAKMTMMKAKEGEHAGRPFFRIDEFVRGNVQNGRNGKKGLGKPVLGQSIKQDGGAFKLGMPEPARVSVVKAEAQLENMPARLMRITKVVQSEDQLPAPVKAKIATRKIWGQVRGVFHAGKLYIIADNLATPEQAMIVFLHEAIGHYGLRKLMGDDLKGLLDQVGALYPEKMRELAAAYRVDIKTDKGWYEIAEEVLAHAAEAGDNRTLMNKIVSMMRQLIRKLGFNLTLNETDVKNILNKSRVAAENGGFDLAGGNVVQPTPMFSIRSSTANETGLDPQIPEDTVAQGIKDGQPVDAIFRGLWGMAEMTQVPKLVKYTSAQTLRGAMNFYDNHMPWAHDTMQYMAKGLIDQYGLDDQYKQLKASTAAMKAEIVDEVRDLIEVMEGMGVTDEDAKTIHEILTNEEPRQEAWDAVTEPIRQRIEELGQRAVDLGLISQESYDRNKGMYLHRVYQKYEMNRSGLEKWADKLSGKRAKKISGEETMERGLSYFVGINRIVEDTGLTAEELIVDGQGATVYKISQMSDNGQKAIRVYYSLKPFEQAGYKSEKFTIRAKHAGRVKIHRDWTKAEREDMGQITDARYVLGKTYSLLAHDLSTGEFFQKISENEAWTLPVENEGDVEVMDGASALHKGGVVTGAEWVRVPTTGIKKSQAKVYGALSGRVIRAEIFQDLNQLNKMQMGGIWKSILTSFKLNKTARNPVVHFNNIMSNLVLMDMADVRFSDLYHAIREMRAEGKLFQEAKRNGAFGVSFAEHDLQNEVLDKLLDEIHDAVGAKPVGLSDVFLSFDSLPFNKQFAFMAKIADTLWHGVDIKGKKVGLKAIDKKMLKYYQNEDQVFRMATYMRRKAQGMNEVEAGLSARDQFLNYDINAPWINALRATIMPFLSYTYRAVPIVAKSIAQRPWKLAKYFTIAYGMNAIAYALTGSDEDKERRSMRDEMSGLMWIGAPRMIRMAWNDEENNPYYWDIRRLIPVGDVFDMNQYHAALPIVPASLMPSGPIAMGFEFMLNKTGFFGEEIVDPLADDWVIGTEKTLDWLWKSYGPSAPWIPYSYYWDKIGIATTGGRDRLGREYDILPALASSFGIKIAPHDVSYGMALKAMEIERTVEAVRHKLNFLEKDYWQHKVSKDSYEATRKRYIMRLEHLEEKARELVGG